MGQYGLKIRGSNSPGLSFGTGASGEEEDEEVALDGEEGSAGPEEERPDGPEGECGHGRAWLLRSCPLLRPLPSLRHQGSRVAPTGHAP